MKNKIFAYGTLSDSKVQMRIWGRLTSGKADILNGYEKSEIDTSDGKFPLIIPSKTKSVPGIIIEVSDEELQKIDEYEGEEYKRIEVETQGGITAWVYVEK